MSDIISWDKAIGKKVKSSDDEDLGKVESITNDYIQTKEGLVSKNYYFIPKYYLIGYDGDNLYVSMTKDEVKSRFERENAPDPSEWNTAEYSRRKEEVATRYPDFATNIPMYRPSAAATVQMPWDKIIGRKVKSADKKDLGEVESISKDYIEVKEGIVSKKHYYIPKYHIQGFDGDNLYVSMTKDEVKDRFERESPPSPSEFQTEEYRELMRKVDSNYPQFVHGIPWMAKEPDTEIPVDYSGTTYNVPWDSIIHKHVRTSDNIEIGYVERVGNEFIVVREGVSDVHIFYVPKTFIRGYDGSTLWIDAPSGLVRSKFEREKEPTPEEIRMLAREAPRFRRKEETVQRTTAAPPPSSSLPPTTTTATSDNNNTSTTEPRTVAVETDVDLNKVDSSKATSESA